MMHGHQEVVAVVPAFNEEQTIGDVVCTLVDSHFFADVVVVSDGSTDKTAERARQAGARVFECKQNRGKGAAMRYGVRETRAPLIFFCDADLIGLTRDHMRTLLTPVQSRALAMCVGLRDRGRIGIWLSKYLPIIGGERVLRREIFEAIPDRYLQGYRSELAMNACCKAFGLKMGTRPLPGLSIRRKMQKVGFWKGLLGFKGYVNMSVQLVHATWLIWVARFNGRF